MDLRSDAHRASHRQERRLHPLAVVGMFGVLVMAVVIGVVLLIDPLPSDGSPTVDGSRFPPIEAMALAGLVEGRGAGLDQPDMGHEHMSMEPEPAGLTPAQQDGLASELAIAAGAVPGYDTMEDAAAAGYVQVSTRVEGVGSHWVKWSLVDRPFDPRLPSQLLFDEIKAGNGPELVAFSYWVASAEEPEGFPGDTDHWHQHFGLCFESGWLKNEDVPERSACSGDWMNGSDLWMLHAWIVPGMENPLGVFANVNTRLCERFCE